MLALSRIPTADGVCLVCREDFKKEEEVVGHTGDYPHPIHKSCLRKWGTVSWSCPTCRKIVDMRYMLTLTQKIYIVAIEAIRIGDKAVIGGAIAGFIAGRLGFGGTFGGAMAATLPLLFAGADLKTTIGSVATSVVVTLVAGFFQIVDLKQSNQSIAGGFEGAIAGAYGGALAGVVVGALAGAYLLKTDLLKPEIKKEAFLGAAAGAVAIAGAGTTVIKYLGAIPEGVAVAAAVAGAVGATVISEMRNYQSDESGV
ncbi:MAG: hypothetical protein KR126chlam3_00963 [Chlamydiae bacterium]|nr:hypothetical protein [Chlamydiota bacterium]